MNKVTAGRCDVNRATLRFNLYGSAREAPPVGGVDDLSTVGRGFQRLVAIHEARFFDGADWSGRVIAASIGFLLAVINNYIWNRRWTFRSRARKVHYELLTFFVISCGGYLLNILFLTFFIWILFALLGLEQTSTLPAWANAGAKVSASAVVLTYNFVANRFWTFRDSISS